jgi:hypothetical protein
VGLYFTIREKLRFNPAINRAIYLSQSIFRSNFGRLVGDLRHSPKAASTAKGVALCLRFRDEARYLDEWLEYYDAAGVDHFFLYNNFSFDLFLPVIEPWVAAGKVTLVDWPRVPASPAAEEDCIRRSLGRFAWVGFLDADEFVVIRDGRSIGDFLESFRRAPGVGLHWRYFGSSHHRSRPAMPVILAYLRRASDVNRHIKSFVQPHRAAQCRNSHSWFYHPIGAAVDEHGNPIYGSFDVHKTADIAWINHYRFKSEEDYRSRMARSSTLDQVGMKFPARRQDNLASQFETHNDVLDLCAVDYYRARCETTGRVPKLLETAIDVKTAPQP